MNLRPAGRLEVLMAKAGAWLEIRIALAALKRSDHGPLNRSLIAGWLENDPVLSRRLDTMPAHELSRALKENRLDLVPITTAPAEGLGFDRGERRHSSCVAQRRLFASSR